MKYFIDTEFYEDGTTIDLISIALVAEDGREFYAVSQDAQLHRVSTWVRENVLPHLPRYGDPAWKTRSQIASGISSFVGEDTKPEFWGYYADYDWVALCQLFGTMMHLPTGFPMFCRDLKQFSVDRGSPKHPPDPTDEHNALADARWNRDLYAFLSGLPADEGELSVWGVIAEKESTIACLTAALAARDAAIEAAHARLCGAYRHWDADRDHKVGKIIGDVARSLKAALTTTAPADGEKGGE